MKRVTGIGGIFFKSEQPDHLLSWYEKHLGIQPAQGMPGAVFEWKSPTKPELTGHTIWSLFPKDTQYFNSSSSPFMINYRVEDLRALVAVLREEGVEVEEHNEESEFGLFAWITDPEGNRIELWQPPLSPPGEGPVNRME